MCVKTFLWRLNWNTTMTKISSQRIGRPPLSVSVLCVLHFLLGIGAIFGGGAFIIDPSGELLGIPIQLLEGSFLGNFLLPGIILFFLFGVLPIYLSFAIIKQWSNAMFNAMNLFKDKHWSWTFSLYAGYGICIWIVVQVYIISGIYTIHLVYFFWGICIQIITLLPRSQAWFSVPSPRSVSQIF